jgi:RHS repeat-associated protein
VYDPQGHVISVHDASANLLRAEFYAGDRHVATWNAGALLWNHADGLGTERARTDAGGNVETVCLDSPFGMNLSCTSPTDASPIHLAGMEYDPETGTYHTLHRQYQGGLGRWLTADPAGKEAVHPDDPQTWNLYAYVRNNPLTLTDPTGEEISDDMRLIVRIGQALAKYVKAPPPPEPIATAKPSKPHWQYKQSTGDADLKIGAVTVFHAGTGYAGHGNGKNNPACEHVSGENAGPPPKGTWTIGPMRPYTIETGPRQGHVLGDAMTLTPGKDVDMTGRDGGMLIHGPHDPSRQNDSTGCIILARPERVPIGTSDIKVMEVVE